MSRGSRIDSKGSFLFSNILDDLNKKSVNIEDINVLDFGCGNGRLVSEMSSIGYSTYGCDI